MPNAIHLGQLLRERRTEKGMSLREFSEHLSISHAYLNKLEKGYDPRSGRAVTPTIEVLTKISDGLGVPLDEFLCACGYIEPPTASLELNTLASEFVAAVMDAQIVTLNGEPVKGDKLTAAIDALHNYVSALSKRDK